MSLRDLVVLAGAAVEGVRLARQIARETTATDARATLETLRRTVQTIEGRQQLVDWLRWQETRR